MPDILTVAQRSALMAKVKGWGNASTELRLVAVFRALGITGWRRKLPLPGKPDFVFPARKLAVFVDGCFWHGCPIHATQPKQNAEFWRDNGVRQHEDGRAGGTALKRSGRVSATGRPLGGHAHKSPATKPATSSSPANSAPAAGACFVYGTERGSAKMVAPPPARPRKPHSRLKG